MKLSAAYSAYYSRISDSTKCISNLKMTESVVVVNLNIIESGCTT